MNQGRKHPSLLSPEELLKECQLTFTRRSGPGGQHRNKVETAVILTHLPTGIQAEANERRSQAENRRMALFRLRLKLAIEVRAAVELPSYSPSLLWQSRCSSKRIRVNAEHDDFPALLSEILDVMFAHEMDLPQVAAALECTASQLLKFLKLEPRGWLAFNAQRRAMGLPALK